MGIFGKGKTCPSCGIELSSRIEKCPRCLASLHETRHTAHEKEEYAADASVEQDVPKEAHHNEARNAREDEPSVQTLRLLQEVKSGASWFYFIAGLSAANTVVAFGGGNLSFILALGITQAIDGLLTGAEPAVRIIGLVVNLLLCAGFVLCGIFANKHNQSAFVAGMSLFALDSVVFVVVQDWIGVTLHIVALFFMYKGFNALRKINQMAESTAMSMPGTATMADQGRIE